jgi:hypothetical protein
LTGTENFVQALQGFASVAVRVDADLVEELAAQKAVDRNLPPLSQYVPKSGFNSTNGVVDDPCHRTRPGRGKLQLAKQAMDIARILVQKERFESTQDRSETGSKEAFPPSLNSFIRLDSNKGPIEIPVDDGGLEADDFQ